MSELFVVDCWLGSVPRCTPVGFACCVPTLDVIPIRE
jgi:hypothetical protein